MARKKSKRSLAKDDDEIQQPQQPQAVRLQRYLASAGFGSRRSCEEFILAGRVTVDGKEERTLGASIDPRTQKVCLDGEQVRSQRKRYYILNKPKGYLCTNLDPSGRKRAIDLIAENDRLFTVGRLDENSQGLLLVTNDGDMGNRLAHPRYEVSRTYRVHVVGNPTLETLDELRKGIHFPEGRFQVHGIKQVKVQGKSSVLEMHLKQGRNREIRRMLARVGHKVMSLERISFGPLQLRGVGVGKYRTLKAHEIQALQDLLAGRTHDQERDSSAGGRGRRPKKRGRITGRSHAPASGHRHKVARGKTPSNDDSQGAGEEASPFTHRKKTARGKAFRGKPGTASFKPGRNERATKDAVVDQRKNNQRKKKARGKAAFDTHRKKAFRDANFDDRKESSRDEAAFGDHQQMTRGKRPRFKKKVGGRPVAKKPGTPHEFKNVGKRTSVKKTGQRHAAKKTGRSGVKKSVKKKGGSRGRRR